MNTNNNEQTGSQNGHVEEEFSTLQKPSDDASQEERDEYYANLEKQNAQLYNRTKKAEGWTKDDSGKWVKPAKPVETKEKPNDTTHNSSGNNLNSSDVIAIINAKIPEEDIPEVAEYAAFKKISIAEALKSSVIKTMLSEKAEARKVAEATSTGSQRRGTGKTSDDTLLENASKGIMPEGAEEMARLVALRRKK